jgi:hypothetical protein
MKLYNYRSNACMGLFNFRERARQSENLARELEITGENWHERLPKREPGDPEFTDIELAEYTPILPEKVAKVMRAKRDGEYEGEMVLITAEAEGWPPEFYEGITLKGLEAVVARSDEQAAQRGQDLAGLMPAERAMLESGGPAGLALLAALEPADEATIEAITAIHKRRLTGAGLSTEFADRDSGFLLG